MKLKEDLISTQVQCLNHRIAIKFNVLEEEEFLLLASNPSSGPSDLGIIPICLLTIERTAGSLQKHNETRFIFLLHSRCS